MILSEIKSYMAERGRVSIGDLVNHFRAEPEAIRGMLEHWIRKRRIRRLDGEGTCTGCTKCDAYALEIYEWVESESEAG